MLNTGFKKINGRFKGQDVVSLDQFTSGDIKKVLSIAKKLKPLRIKGAPSKILSGKIISIIFYEPSTRTFSSFCAATKQLGGATIEIHDPQRTTSVAKGETLSDTMNILQSYSDCIVIRHFETGAAVQAADVAMVPVINAGDGRGEHPTQTLLDLYTIDENKGRLSGLTGLLAGDMLNGRTIKSLIRGLSLFKGNTLYLLSPEKLKLSREEFKNLSSRDIKLIEITKEQDIPKNADFWYWTRIQKERFSSLKEYKSIKNSFILCPKLIEKYAGKKTIFMHPLPRINEIEKEVDQNPRALYLKIQMRNGLYVRMALLALVLGKIK